MTRTTTTTRLAAALLGAVALLLASATAALAGGSSDGAAPASFYYEDEQHAVFAGPGFDVDAGCPPADDLDAHFVTTGAGTVQTQGSREVEQVAVYELADYGATTALEVLVAICFLGAPDEPVMLGGGTVWLRNTNCDPGPNGCYAPGSSWSGKNWLKGTVLDVDGVAHDVKAFARVDVELPLDAPPVETLLDLRLRIR